VKKPAQSKFGILADQNFVYGLIVVFFALYFITGVWLFGVFIGLSILWAVVLEFWLGAKENGWKNEIKETLIALALALLVWFGAGFMLQTPSPLNAIVSCSMLPHVSRGDMVVLRGDRLQAPLVDVPSVEGIGNAAVYQDGALVANLNGSVYAYCTQKKFDTICNQFIRSPGNFTEKQGPLTIGYDKCEIVYPKSGQKQVGPCVSYLEVGGVRYTDNLSNDVAVYQPGKDEYYSRVGDIIHRAFIKLRTPDGKEYFLTKGDNNPVFDFQVYDSASGEGNLPVEMSRYKGRILFAVPYVGYLKLFISPGAIPTPDGCDRVYAKWS